MTAPPQSRTRVLLRTLVVVGIGTSVLALTGLALSRFFTDRPVTDLLAEVEWHWLVLATLCVLLGTGSHGPRMRPLLPPRPGGRRPGAGALGSLYVAASVLNLSFPGPAGELAAAVVLGRTHGQHPTAVLAASLHARFVALLVAALITLAALPVLDIPADVRPIAWAGAGGLGIGGAVLGGLSFRPDVLRGLSLRTNAPLARSLPGAVGRLFGKIHQQVMQLSESLVAVPRQGLGAYLSAAAWSLGSLLTSFTAILCAAQAFGLSPDWLGTFVTLCLTLIAAIALILLPGGLGSFDLTLVGMLVASAGLTAEEAGLVLLGVRVAQVASIALAAVVFLYWARQLLSADVVAQMNAGSLADPDDGVVG
ncbi:MAG: lysylphosphatidylglycerol synthase domain-containing protein [Myxococcota bacterium]|nr:lysylphosphatidylglycerol synthase domain-containing protein [Myxococcota bacterium]MEC8422659.1 lysylphosphatidylglycerol synthase domain-containing protein [Myxococcota bacterium]